MILNWNLVPSGHWARISAADWLISSLVTGPKGCDGALVEEPLVVAAFLVPSRPAFSPVGVATLVSSAVMMKDDMRM